MAMPWRPRTPPRGRIGSFLLLPLLPPTHTKNQPPSNDGYLVLCDTLILPLLGFIYSRKAKGRKNTHATLVIRTYRTQSVCAHTVVVICMCSRRSGEPMFADVNETKKRRKNPDCANSFKPVQSNGWNGISFSGFFFLKSIP